MSDDTGNQTAQDTVDEPDDVSTERQGRPERGAVLAWSPDGTLLALGGSDGARIVEVGSGDERLHLEHGCAVSALAWSPDSTLLAIACADGGASIVEVGSGDVRHRLNFAAEARDSEPRTGLEHGEAELEDLQQKIDRVRTQTGEERGDDQQKDEDRDDDEHHTDDQDRDRDGDDSESEAGAAGDSEAPPPPG